MTSASAFDAVNFALFPVSLTRVNDWELSGMPSLLNTPVIPLNDMLIRRNSTVDIPASIALDSQYVLYVPTTAWESVSNSPCSNASISTSTTNRFTKQINAEATFSFIGMCQNLV